jgi:hypothetical protein
MDKLVVDCIEIPSDGGTDETKKRAEERSVTSQRSRRRDFVRTGSRRLPGQKRVTSYAIRRSNNEKNNDEKGGEKPFSEIAVNGVLTEKLKTLNVVF